MCLHQDISAYSCNAVKILQTLDVMVLFSKFTINIYVLFVIFSQCKHLQCGSNETQWAVGGNRRVGQQWECRGILSDCCQTCAYVFKWLSTLFCWCLMRYLISKCTEVKLIIILRHICIPTSYVDRLCLVFHFFES